MFQLTTRVVLNVNQQKFVKIERSLCVSRKCVVKLVADLQNANNETVQLNKRKLLFPGSSHVCVL